MNALHSCRIPFLLSTKRPLLLCSRTICNSFSKASGTKSAKEFCDVINHQQQISIRQFNSSTQRLNPFTLPEHHDNPADYDPICELASSTLRFGPSSTSEIGQDLANLNARRILLFVDPHVSKLPSSVNPLMTLLTSIEKYAPKNHTLDIYDQIRVEPNNVSFRHAISYMTDQTSLHGPYDVIIALGGGSTIDTAKAANLYTCHPTEDFYDYVNPPLGKGKPVPMTGKLVPLIAVPTTAGTGSETTGVAIFDDVPTRSKTGIAHRLLKPTLAVVDPNNMRTMPEVVAKYSGIDVLCHAIESYTAIPYKLRPGGKPSSPILRPAYQGSNPISDIWSMHALRECTQYLPRMVQQSDGEHGECGDEEARSKMSLAASCAGYGFGNAGVHLCHGMSYPVASQVGEEFWVEGYPRLDWRGDEDGNASDVSGGSGGHKDKHGFVPHGLSVIINAPSVFRFTGDPKQGNFLITKYSMDRHVECTKVLARARVERNNGAAMPSEAAMRDQPGETLAYELEELMHDLNIPIGLRTLGYTGKDVDALARGTLPQHRVTKLSPRQPVGLDELKELFMDALDG